MKINLGVNVETKRAAHIDIVQLLVQNLLLQANSGGGKSWALRRFVEEAFGKVQIIIIDPEGEFSTLREKHDFVLVGEDGETSIDVRSAEMLAHRLLELKASAICDLYAVKSKATQRAWVKAFVDGLMNAPKRLWHSLVLVVDEVHDYCPEKPSKEDVASDALIAYGSKGRKRGFGMVAATQRLAKLNKDLASELKNALIGLTWMDLDRERAAETLGLRKADRTHFFDAVKLIPPGNFFALGRALFSTEPTRLHVGEVFTTHPEPGKPMPITPPPTAKIQHLLPQLKDIPVQAEQKLRTEADLRRRIAELEAQGARTESRVVERVVEKIPQDFVAALKELNIACNRVFDAFDTIDTANTRLGAAISAIHKCEDRAATSGAQKEHDVRTPRAPDRGRREVRIERRSTDADLGKGERLTLIAVAQHSDGVTREQLTVLTGYKRSTRDAYVQRLRTAGLVDLVGLKIAATEDGVAALGDDYQPLPKGRALREYHLQRLPEGERRVLEILVTAYPRSIARTDIDEKTGYARSSRDAYLQRLSARKLVRTEHDGSMVASDELF